MRNVAWSVFFFFFFFFFFFCELSLRVCWCVFGSMRIAAWSVFFVCFVCVYVGVCLVQCALLHGLFLFAVFCLCVGWCEFG